MRKVETTKYHNLLTAERRRRIVEFVQKRGFVTVADLTSEFNVTANTVRCDLDALDSENKLVRSRGGAVVVEKSVPAPPYSKVRDANMPLKSQIARAALSFLPMSGSVFINSGSTTLQLVQLIPDVAQIEIATNSPEIAVFLMEKPYIEVSIIGGKMINESRETDGSLNSDLLENVYWDIAFMGLSALDIEHGITSINLACARMESAIIKNAKEVIALCDSSKLGKYAHAKVSSITEIDTLITDSSASDKIITYLKDNGVNVVIAR